MNTQKKIKDRDIHIRITSDQFNKLRKIANLTNTSITGVIEEQIQALESQYIKIF